MKTILLGSLITTVSAAALLLSGTASADTTTLNDGTNNADIQVNGTLGADNTDPSAPIPEGSDKWINVTVDTATIFYNTSTSTDITSPSYSIKNNSGRPVNVKVNSFTQKDNVPITSIGALNLNLTRSKTASNPATTSTTALISKGALTTDYSSAATTTLANGDGQLASSDAKGAFSNTGTFSYSGNVTSKLSSVINPTFTMNLIFSAGSL